MGKPASLFGGAVTGMARDYPRDRMPQGYVWDLADYVPILLDAALTGRGGWVWGSAAHPTQIEGGIYAPFKSGDRLLTIAGGKLYDVNQTTGALTQSFAGLSPIKQNPVQTRDTVVIFDGVNVPWLVNSTASAPVVTASPASAKPFLYGTVFKDMILGANYPGQEQQLVFSYPGDPTHVWPDNSLFNSSLPLTGVAGLRSSILLFHQGSVERIRGSKPPHDQDTGDMFMEGLYDRAGCGDARSIAYWNDNVIFADERGVHLSDGATVRNLMSQGGMLIFWRTLFKNRLSVSSCTYLDYYITTVVRSDGIAVTLICDLNRRGWFRFTNVKSTAYIQSVGSQERIWAGLEPDHRLASISECFFPVLAPSTLAQDGNGVPVLPLMETPWFRMGNEGRKRSRFVYASYDVRVPPGATAMGWRKEFEAEELNGIAVHALQQMIEVGYMVSPNELTYTVAGRLPDTTEYRRYRLPINKAPYGIAFRLKQVVPSTVTRLYDFAIDAPPEEPSRV